MLCPPLFFFKNIKGFTLVELSIVIVVIGLIIGGVVAGKDLVQAAKLHSDISKFKEYKMAYSLFMEQYNAVPGDMRNATSYWPSAAGNGNGNKLISGGGEAELAWQHLALAKLIDGSYNGTSDAPRPSISSNNTVFLGMFAHGAVMWGIYSGNSTNSMNIMGSFWNVVSTNEAFTIDTKMDDGIPTKGKVTAFSEPVNDSIKEANGTTDATYHSYVGIGSYNLSETAGFCSITMWLSR